MDIVIPLGGVQRWDHIELRYALRSIEKHMKDLRNVWIIGELPDWIKNVRHVEIFDITNDPRESVMTKILTACSHPDISDDFILSHDDIFALKDFEGETLPFYANSNKTGSLVAPVHFAVHTPFRINKKMYGELYSKVNLDRYQSPRSFYLNFYRATGTQYEDKIPNSTLPPAEIRKSVQEAPFTTCNDRACGDQRFIDFLDSLFPTPSRFELRSHQKSIDEYEGVRPRGEE